MRNHLLFWLLYVGFTVSIYYVQEPDLLLHLTYELASLPAKILLVYFTVYYLLPRYLLPGKYRMGTGLWLLSLIGCVYLLYLLVSLSVYPWFYPDVRTTLIPENPGKMVAPLLDLIIVTALAVVIKLLQERQQSERERLLLASLNARHELQLLRSQLHPHFLFNTLNGLYAYTLEAPGKAAEMIVKLSELLRFMLYEGSRPLVSLREELAGMQHYVALESIRHGSKLQLDLQLDGEVDQQQVVPLMMLPFFENAFKHGPAKLHEPCSINGRIRVDPGWLILELSNSKKEAESSATRAGIGLKNVKQRLRHCYGDRHELILRDEPDLYSVFLKIPLS